MRYTDKLVRRGSELVGHSSTRNNNQPQTTTGGSGSECQPNCWRRVVQRRTNKAATIIEMGGQIDIIDEQNINTCEVIVQRGHETHAHIKTKK